MAGSAGKRGPNFLLYLLVGLSLAVHASLVVYWVGRAPDDHEIPVEIEIGPADAPPARTLPRPPSVPPARQSAPPPPDMPAELPEPTLPEPAPEMMSPRETPPAPPVPDLAADPRLPVAQWQAEPRPAPSKGSQSDYFTRVRRALENGKQYPASARQRRLEGEVVLKFTIARDGGVSALSVTKGSGFSSLDDAALAAVRSAEPFPPLPADLFDGPLELTVPIRFELTD